jgi:hypothetical protein
MLRVCVAAFATFCILSAAVPAADAPADAEKLRRENERLAVENTALQLKIEELMTAKAECLEGMDMLRHAGAGK